MGIREGKWPCDELRALSESALFFRSALGSRNPLTPTAARFPRFFRYFGSQSPANHDFYPNLLLGGGSLAM